jgi:hypothetical protein
VYGGDIVGASLYGFAYPYTLVAGVPIAAVAGGTGNAAQQGFEYLSGDRTSFDTSQVQSSGIIAGGTQLALGFLPIPFIGSSALAKQMATKLEKGTISRVSNNTMTKIAISIPKESLSVRPVLLACDMNAERKPTADEQAGMDWWNALPEKERATWLKVAVSARPADAWRVYQQVRDGEYRPDITWRPDPGGQLGGRCKQPHHDHGNDEITTMVAGGEGRGQARYYVLIYMGAFLGLFQINKQMQQLAVFGRRKFGLSYR